MGEVGFNRPRFIKSDLVSDEPRRCKCGGRAWYRVGNVGYCGEHRRQAEQATKAVLEAYMKFKWDWYIIGLMERDYVQEEM